MTLERWHHCVGYPSNPILKKLVYIESLLVSKSSTVTLIVTHVIRVTSCLLTFHLCHVIVLLKLFILMRGVLHLLIHLIIFAFM